MTWPTSLTQQQVWESTNPWSGPNMTNKILTQQDLQEQRERIEEATKKKYISSFILSPSTHASALKTPISLALEKQLANVSSQNARAALSKKINTQNATNPRNQFAFILRLFGFYSP